MVPASKTSASGLGGGLHLWAGCRYPTLRRLAARYLGQVRRARDSFGVYVPVLVVVGSCLVGLNATCAGFLLRRCIGCSNLIAGVRDLLLARGRSNQRVGKVVTCVVAFEAIRPRLDAATEGLPHRRIREVLRVAAGLPQIQAGIARVEDAQAAGTHEYVEAERTRSLRVGALNNERFRWCQYRIRQVRRLVEYQLVTLATRVWKTTVEGARVRIMAHDCVVEFAVVTVVFGRLNHFVREQNISRASVLNGNPVFATFAGILRGGSVIIAALAAADAARVALLAALHGELIGARAWRRQRVATGSNHGGRCGARCSAGARAADA